MNTSTRLLAASFAAAAGLFLAGCDNNAAQDEEPTGTATPTGVATSVGISPPAPSMTGGAGG